MQTTDDPDMALASTLTERPWIWYKGMRFKHLSYGTSVFSGMHGFAAQLELNAHLMPGYTSSLCRLKVDVMQSAPTVRFS